MLAYVLANAASYIAYLLLADRVSKDVSEKVLLATKSADDVGDASYVVIWAKMHRIECADLVPIATLRAEGIEAFLKTSVEFSL
jgi:hypothetical protein